jgi:hypothetical protein
MRELLESHGYVQYSIGIFNPTLNEKLDWFSHQNHLIPKNRVPRFLIHDKDIYLAQKND